MIYITIYIVSYFLLEGTVCHVSYLNSSKNKAGKLGILVAGLLLYSLSTTLYICSYQNLCNQQAEIGVNLIQ
jgi:hypothetical protein